MFDETLSSRVARLEEAEKAAVARYEQARSGHPDLKDRKADVLFFQTALAEIDATLTRSSF